MAERVGNSTVRLSSRPSVLAAASAVGKLEHEGPLAVSFEIFCNDEFWGETTFEKAEVAMQKAALAAAIDGAGVTADAAEAVFAGDLLNQCTATSFAMRDMGLPLAGLYGACSTFALSLGLAALSVESGGFACTMGCASSHFCTAERQYRQPLEYGGQRSQAAQRTATAAGAAVIGVSAPDRPHVDCFAIGRVRDLGIKDAANMGAAMAPAAAQTIECFLRDTGTKPGDYGMILTGDLGATGSALLLEILRTEAGLDLSAVHADCGCLLFDAARQDVHSGGSGAGCSAAVVCSHILKRLQNGELPNVLFVGTGALLSPTTTLQGETVPGIAHAVLLTAG